MFNLHNLKDELITEDSGSEETFETLDEIFLEALLSEETHEKGCKELNEIKKMILDKDISNETLSRIFGEDLSILNLDPTDEDIVEKIDKILEDFDFTEVSNERLTDAWDHGMFLDKLAAVVFYPFMVMSRINAMIAAIDDIKHYETKVLAKLDPDKVEENLEKRYITTFDAELLMKRINGIAAFVNYVADSVTSEHKIELGKVKHLLNNIGLPGFWEQIGQDFKQLFGFGLMKRKTLEDHGYTRDSISEFSSIFQKVRSDYHRIKGATHKTSLDGASYVFSLDDVEHVEDEDARTVVKLFKKGMQKIAMHEVQLVMQARAISKQIVYSSLLNNMFTR